MVEEIPIANEPLSAEEAALVAKLSKEELAHIDETILSVVNPHWRKVAMVVAKSMGALEGRYPEFSETFYTERIRALVDSGRLESQGNISYMRFSEVRLARS